MPAMLASFPLGSHLHALARAIAPAVAATYGAGFMLGRYVHRASADLARLVASF
jgi:hypothetical protein